METVPNNEDEQAELKVKISKLIERIVVHVPDKSSGHRVQQVDIYYRFNIAVSTAIAERKDYDKKCGATYKM